MATAASTSTKGGINLRNYESAVASILSKCDAEQQSSDCSCPLLHFPPTFRPLPAIPNETILNTINSSVGEVSAGKETESQVQALSVCSDRLQSRKKATSRLAKKRAAKKQRKEAETGGEVQPPCWPFNILPPAACPRLGGRLSGRRARKKEGQLSSMIRCVLAMLPDSAFGRREEGGKDAADISSGMIRLVDFAGGSGHLALPLALLLPRCQVVMVDLKERSLAVARERAKACGHLPNLIFYHGSITRYTEAFDIGLALHACGEATDLVLKACGQAKAAFVASPCCVGKLMGFNPYVFQSSGDTMSNEPSVKYPQSDFYRSHLNFSSSDFDALAKAADHAEDDGLNTTAIKRTAKILLEADRLASVVEQYGYDRSNVALTRMEPLDSSPKNDILLGWGHGLSLERGMKPPNSVREENHTPDPCISEAKSQLSLLSSVNADDMDIGQQNVCIDWTSEEERLIRNQLTAKFGRSSEDGTTYLLKSDKEQIYRFPTGMGARQRRLIHYVASDMGLAHWGEGEKSKDKIVCVTPKA
mmetsp:Transcript_12282/g.26040  ORF Transcript_12282/g.26040 Transcript_12282/m.26040 type:complete len:533 (+) Transcript_12282:73-1671(+)